MKKIILFLSLFLPWFLSSFFAMNSNFYKTLNLPFFAPKPVVFAIVWPILYFLIALSIYLIVKEYGLKNNKEYRNIVIINYILNQLYPFLFFGVKSLFFSFVDTVALTISTLFLYYETKSLNKTSSKLLLPYLFWTIFALILSVTIYFMNL